MPNDPLPENPTLVDVLKYSVNRLELALADLHAHIAAVKDLESLTGDLLVIRDHLSRVLNHKPEVLDSLIPGFHAVHLAIATACQQAGLPPQTQNEATLQAFRPLWERLNAPAE